MIGFRKVPKMALVSVKNYNMFYDLMLLKVWF